MYSFNKDHNLVVFLFCAPTRHAPPDVNIDRSLAELPEQQKRVIHSQSCARNDNVIHSFPSIVLSGFLPSQPSSTSSVRRPTSTTATYPYAHPLRNTLVNRTWCSIC